MSRVRIPSLAPFFLPPINRKMFVFRPMCEFVADGIPSPDLQIESFSPRRSEQWSGGTSKSLDDCPDDRYNNGNPRANQGQGADNSTPNAWRERKEQAD